MIDFSRKSLIKVALQQRAKVEDNWINVKENRLLQIWYTFKVIICVLFGWETHYKLNSWKLPLKNDDPVLVACFNVVQGYSYEFGTTHDWEELLVGYGIFSDWKYVTRSNGCP